MKAEKIIDVILIFECLGYDIVISDSEDQVLYDSKNKHPENTLQISKLSKFIESNQDVSIIGNKGIFLSLISSENNANDKAFIKIKYQKKSDSDDSDDLDSDNSDFDDLSFNDSDIDSFNSNNSTFKNSLKDAIENKNRDANS